MTLNPQPILVSEAGHYFTIAELRASAEELASATTYPDAVLEAKRDEAEEDFEAIAHRCFFPRTTTIALRGGDEYLFVPGAPYRDIRSLTGITRNGVALDIGSVTVDPIVGAFRHAYRWPEGILMATFEYGVASPPARVKAAVMQLAKIYIVPSAIDPRATAVINTEIGGYRISVADGKTGRTGIPEVDAAARRYGDNTPSVG